MAHFSVNKIINRIILTLNEYEVGSGVYPFKDKCHNHFGDEAGSFEELLTQNNHIYIFYGNEEDDVLTNNMMTGNLYIEFWVIDLTKGVASDKADFQADNLRAYLGSGAWRTLGVDILYPEMNFRPFFCESKRPAILMDDKGQPTGYMLTSFRGYFGFDSSMS